MLLTKNDLATISGGVLRYPDLGGEPVFKLESVASTGYTDYGNTPVNLKLFGRAYCGLTMVACRDEFIATHFPDWGTMSDADKKILIGQWLWPAGTPVPELDALYTSAERDDFRDSTCEAMEAEGVMFLMSPAGKVFKMVTNEFGALSTTEITTDSN